MNKPPRWHKGAPAPKRPDRPLWATAATSADKPPSRAPAKPVKNKRKAAYHEAPDARLKRFLKCK